MKEPKDAKKAQIIPFDEIKNFLDHKKVNGDLAKDVAKELEYLSCGDKPLWLIPSGSPELDKPLAGGFQSTELIAITGLPGVGKLSFALKIAIDAMTPEYPTLLISLKRSVRQIFWEMTSLRSRVTQNHLLLEELGESEWPKIICTLATLREYPIIIDDSENLLEKIAIKIEILRKKIGLRLAIIDDLQMLGVIENKGGQRVSFHQICGRLKLLAKELDVAIILLSSAGRHHTSRPRLSDLPKYISATADIVIGLHKPAPKKNDKQQTNESFSMEIIKNGRGPR